METLTVVQRIQLAGPVGQDLLITTAFSHDSSTLFVGEASRHALYALQLQANATPGASLVLVGLFMHDSMLLLSSLLALLVHAVEYVLV